MSLQDFVNDIKVVDSHAHPGMWDVERGYFLKHKDLKNLFPEAMLLSVLSNSQQNELIANSQKVLNDFNPEIEKWANMRSCCHYEIIQENSYKHLYGTNDAQTVDAERNKHFSKVYENVIKNSKIEFVMANLPAFPQEYENNPVFKWVPYLDQFIFAKSSPIERLQDALHHGTIGMYEKALFNSLKKEAVALETLTLDAYVDKNSAQKIWDSDFSKLDKNELKLIQDYLACFAIRSCAKIGLPIQIHAAFGDAPGLLWKNATPVNLEKFFADPSFFHPTIILLHGGMPEYFLAGWYASTYANVYLDFSWLSMFSDNVLIKCLNEWLDFVPYNKLLFGTDAWSPELFWAATNEGRRIVTKVLSYKLQEKKYTLKQCEDVATALLRDNAMSVYNLNKV